MSPCRLHPGQGGDAASAIVDLPLSRVGRDPLRVPAHSMVKETTNGNLFDFATAFPVPLKGDIIPVRPHRYSLSLTSDPMKGIILMLNYYIIGRGVVVQS